MTHYHPKRDSSGRLVPLHHPHTPAALETWLDAKRLATVVPGSAMPPAIFDIPISSWTDAPSRGADWERLALDPRFDEPPYQKPDGMKAASGAVVVEADGRIWVVSPSNKFAGYCNTFPKGTVSAKEPLSLRANALKEVHEEAGLRISLIRFLCDSLRNQSYTRYYLAHRIGGNPADMGWESQAAHLVPPAGISQFVTHPNDRPILAALNHLGSALHSGS